MRGESVDLENIGKTVTDGFDKASNQVNKFIHSEKPRTTLQKIADFIVSFFGVVLKIGAILLAIVLVPALLLVLLVLLVVVISLIAGGLGTVFSGIPFLGSNIQMMTNVPDYITAIESIGGILLVAIPLFALFYMLFKRPLNLNPMSNIAKWILLIVWVIALIVVGAVSVWAFKEYGSNYMCYYQSSVLMPGVFPIEGDMWKCLVEGWK